MPSPTSPASSLRTIPRIMTVQPGLGLREGPVSYPCGESQRGLSMCAGLAALHKSAWGMTDARHAADRRA
jgi:hypothetical protein